jgi:hypothetical protein
MMQRRWGRDVEVGSTVRRAATERGQVAGMVGTAREEIEEDKRSWRVFRSD